jgi:hypothetical protein
MSDAPILSFVDNSLTHPSRLDAAYLEATMLWPTDKDADKRTRDEALKTSTSEFGRSIWQILPAEVADQLFALAADTFPPRAMKDLSNEPFLHGFIAGRILRLVVSRVSRGVDDETASMDWIVNSLSKEYSPNWRLRPRTIQNKIWHNFRCVAHLWAAWIEGVQGTGEFIFPCRPESLRAFLATAEAYRRLGEQTSTWKSPTTVLKSRECYVPPIGLILPVVSPNLASAA